MLPATYAMALSMRDDGVSETDIAERLGVDQDAVPTFFALVEEKLTAILLGHGPSPS